MAERDCGSTINCQMGGASDETAGENSRVKWE